MAYEHVKVVGVFCDAIVEGGEEFMREGKRYDGKGGYPERWLKKKPEHKWAWNGLTAICTDGKEREARFYLCPNHQTQDDWLKAFKWADKHSKRVSP